MTDTDDQDYGPEYEVWNHLQSGLERAEWELDALDSESRKVVEGFAAKIVDARAEFAIRPESIEAKLADIEDTLLENNWLRHAVEVKIAQFGVNRANDALTRLLKLKPVVTDKAIPSRVKSYLREVVDTYAFGFDMACIALCRATCEQVLKEVLVASGAYTVPRLRRERLTAGGAIQKAREEGLLKTSSEAARLLVEKGDWIMHRSVYKESIIEQQALDSISQLSEVLVEVLR